MGPSRSPLLPYMSTLFSTIFLGFGLTYMLSPRTGYAVYGFSSQPSNAHDWAIVERIMVLYGAKDVFIAAAVYSSTWFGTRRSAGMVLVAAGACAGVDGYVVKSEAGTGEWNHWGYKSVMGVVGSVMAGLLGLEIEAFCIDGRSASLAHP
ncbi:uncharacterized protein M421DRAFT_422332 [Didymella exigua CBS 183.55]|uniref:Uncharacterized protein n=1 Tax=Didymella exigua CBS 183.55 TaxID=1150837 RepID=A0A6A5RGW6_9PLEO|nr:uncharacterized protein M421DRAFT_422332 [Didymella exigua CBS 183.55]KAF1926733.1 hypothetical protein M421DRAFT_422332 [Didymella exigua CBS 183.55]